MKIDTQNLFGINNKADGTKTGKLTGKGNLVVNGAAQETSAKTTDTVKISDRSRLISKATELATLAPDIRSEKVADLTARIAAGTYNVSSRDVADSIIKKSISGVI